MLIQTLYCLVFDDNGTLTPLNAVYTLTLVVPISSEFQSDADPLSSQNRCSGCCCCCFNKGFRHPSPSTRHNSSFSATTCQRSTENTLQSASLLHHRLRDMTDTRRLNSVSYSFIQFLCSFNFWTAVSALSLLAALLFILLHFLQLFY